ncbi:mitochondrial ribosomal protein L47 isoform X2 [Lycorma delicatula]
MEFFDDKKNWGQDRVYVGRSWRKEELRIKSNSDLHKLWYVLLKEKNMLLTMEHECAEKNKIFPNPERIDKVMESMHHLEEVVRERNQAYYKLETGETGERPAKVVYNQLGLTFFYKMFEHLIPKFMNKKWRDSHKFYYSYSETKQFLLLYREKLFNEKRKALNRDKNHVQGLFKRFPNMDEEFVREKYSELNIDNLKEKKKALGHKMN